MYSQRYVPGGAITVKTPESPLLCCTGNSLPISESELDNPMNTAAFGRFDRSRGRSIESIGSVGSVILWIFQFFRHVGELEICLVSKFQLCTTLGGRKNAEKPKREFSIFSVRSVRYSVRFDRYCVRGPWWIALLTALFQIDQK